MTLSTKFWIYSIGISALIFSIGLAELAIRRQSPINLYLINKALASTAFLMISGSYTLSAIHHFLPKKKRILAYRRYLGLTGYGLAILHVGSVFIVHNPDQLEAAQFPFPDFFLENILAITLGLAGLGIFSYAFRLSINTKRFTRTAAATRKWRRQLRYGYWGVLLIFVHSFLLKYEGWLSWIASFDPILPPLSLIVSILVSLLIGFKIVQLVREKRFF